MEEASSRHEVCSGTDRTSVSFDFSAFDALPDNSVGIRKARFSEEQDAALLKYWPTKNHDAVAKLIGHATGTCLRRYRELCQKG